ncbi:hypothetical protein AB0H71_09965 [Nocardia sp. NPDC050697]|uniref:hypothetical protein n=1 Tax=Nocardia sp. NPDC050697 TaxID=3155158 RepID=UPI0033E3AC15
MAVRIGGPVIVFPTDPGAPPPEPGGIPPWATPESGYPGTYEPPSDPQLELLDGETVVAVGMLADGEVGTLTVASEVTMNVGDVLTVRVAESGPEVL